MKSGRKREDHQLSIHSSNCSNSRNIKINVYNAKIRQAPDFFSFRQPPTTLWFTTPYRDSVVISLSKIKISKAIHNYHSYLCRCRRVVISLSKIKISKAIHNHQHFFHVYLAVVISLSKIKISKAIHNSVAEWQSVAEVVISLSKIKISKAIHNMPDMPLPTDGLSSVCQR